MTDGYEMFQAVLSLNINEKQDKRVYEFLKGHPLLRGRFTVEDLKANEEKERRGCFKKRRSNY